MKHKPAPPATLPAEVTKPAAPAIIVTTGFDKADIERLDRVHPMLRKLFIEARKQTEFTIRDTNRGRAAQEAAFNAGKSKVHYGHSAHNWMPSVAADIYPLPINFSNLSAFTHLQITIIKPLAAKLQIPIRQGIDFNRNGILTDDKWDDLPHIELYPWEDWAKECKPYGG